MTKIISGKLLAKSIKDALKEEIDSLVNNGKRRPKLSVILVGNDPASKSYVSGKSKACEECGIINETILMPENISEEELLKKIDELNNDSTVDGILVQLPLPKHINESRVIEAVEYKKDVDGFHSQNVAKLYSKKECIEPCTPKGIIKLIKKANVNMDGANAVVIGRSNIVGQPVAKLLMNENATVTICHSHTKNMKQITKHADILVVAIGKAKFVDKSFVKHDACVIDVGVNRDNETGKLCGDCNFDSLNGYVKVLTKVPGGVGPMTIASLMENTLTCYKIHENLK
jgi:methylenetetrahydrofolate dehydrogenase (NADP+)/methenyltetrahydrofolate cyclohydrolase